MPTISTDGTPASSGSFETAEKVPSDTSNQDSSNTQVEVGSIQNLHSSDIAWSDQDFHGDSNTSNLNRKMELCSENKDVDNIKPTSSQVERADVTAKLEQIAGAEKAIDKEIFHSMEDARHADDIGVKAQNTPEKSINETIIGIKMEESVANVLGESVNKIDLQWVDVIGSGDIMKKVIRSGEKHTRPHRGQVVTVNLKGLLDNDVEVESLDDFSFTLGDAEVIQGLELAIPLMDKKETATILVKARFAYGELGREPDIPSNSNIKYTIELLDVFDEPTVESLSVCERMRIGSGKKDRGNFWFTRGDYSQAIVCYRRALEFLDDEMRQVFADGSESFQQLIEDRLKVYNNLALAQLKVDAFDAAIISVDHVLRIQPQNVKALFRKGKVLAAQGNTDDAINCMRKALKLEPDTKVIHAELSRLQSQKTLENASERELYRKMLGEQRHLVRAKRSSKFKVWGSFLGGLAAVVVGIFAYRQYHALGRDLNFLLISSFLENVKDKVSNLINTVAGKLEQEQADPAVVSQTATVESPTM